MVRAANATCAKDSRTTQFRKPREFVVCGHCVDSPGSCAISPGIQSITVFLALVTVPVYLSGEPAEEMVEDLAGRATRLH